MSNTSLLWSYKNEKKRKKRKHHSTPIISFCHFQDTITLKSTRPLHEIKPVSCSLQMRTHTKKARAVRLCSVKEALMLMEHNRGGKGLFGCKEMQRTWHVWWGAFLTCTFVIWAKDEVVTKSLFPHIILLVPHRTYPFFLGRPSPGRPPISPCGVSQHHPWLVGVLCYPQ